MIRKIKSLLTCIPGYHWLSYRTWNRFHILRMRYLAAGYHDCDEILIHSMFEVLCRFVEDEDIDGIVDWNSDPDHIFARTEIQVLYAWWRNRQSRDSLDPLRQLGVVHPQWTFTPCKDSADFSEVHIEHGSDLERQKWEEACRASRLWEAQCRETDEEMMIRLVKIRGYLWT